MIMINLFSHVHNCVHFQKDDNDIDESHLRQNHIRMMKMMTWQTKTMKMMMNDQVKLASNVNQLKPEEVEEVCGQVLAQSPQVLYGKKI